MSCVGILHWAVELGRFDVAAEVSFQAECKPGYLPRPDALQGEGDFAGGHPVRCLQY